VEEDEAAVAVLNLLSAEVNLQSAPIKSGSGGGPEATAVDGCQRRRGHERGREGDAPVEVPNDDGRVERPAIGRGSSHGGGSELPRRRARAGYRSAGVPAAAHEACARAQPASGDRQGRDGPTDMETTRFLPTPKQVFLHASS
jgi:hypothetical protein